MAEVRHGELFNSNGIQELSNFLEGGGVPPWRVRPPSSAGPMDYHQISWQPAETGAFATVSMAIDDGEMKKLIFRKTGTKADEVEFVDAGKTLTKIMNPSQGILPHDLIHALVESILNVRGFTDLIFEGQQPSYAMKADGEAWLAESMVESIQGMLWSGQLDYNQFNDWIRTICESRKVPAILIDSRKFSALNFAITEMSQKWKQLAPGESVEVSWPLRW